MIQGTRDEVVVLFQPAAIVDNASLAVAELDTIGANYLTIDCFLGATDIGITALKVTESDTAGSGHADVTGLIFGTSVNTDGITSILPSATDDNKVFGFQIDLRKRKRYIDMVATFGDGTVGGFMVIVARLTRNEIDPLTPAQRGYAQILRV